MERQQWRDCLPGLRELDPEDSCRRYLLAGQKSIFSLREKAVWDIQGCSEPVRREADGAHNKKKKKKKMRPGDLLKVSEMDSPSHTLSRRGTHWLCLLTLGPRTLHTH